MKKEQTDTCVKVLKVKLKPTKEQAAELTRLSKEYIYHANQLVQQAVSDGRFPTVTSRHIETSIPSVVKNELIRYAKSKYAEHGNCVFKKRTVSWNNQNYTVTPNHLAFPIMQKGKSMKTAIKAVLTSDQFDLLSQSKRGAMRITKKGYHWIAQIAYHVLPSETVGTDVLGIDLGILCPAVGVVASSGQTAFFGNGRSNKVIRRKYKKLRRELGKKKKLNAIRTLNDKEARIMQDINHKIARHIVRFAADTNCGTIHLENLSGIRRTSRQRGKHTAILHNWTFAQLTDFIEYKAREIGIVVKKVNPEYTSQTCPTCKARNKVTDRTYQCGCGYRGHRDRVGALNIAQTT